eukprot:6207071-Pleurochrysis_carterae.AAC.2
MWLFGARVQVELDETASDAMVQLKEDLLRSERIDARIVQKAFLSLTVGDTASAPNTHAASVMDDSVAKGAMSAVPVFGRRGSRESVGSFGRSKKSLLEAQPKA